MLGLRQKVGGDHPGITAVVGQHVDLRRSSQLVDPYRTEDLALCLVHEGIARTHDLVDLRHAFGAESHGGDGLRASDAEDHVSARKVASGDHVGVRGGRQAGYHGRASCDLRGDDGHYRCRKQRIATSWHIGADGMDGYYAVAKMDARQRLDLQWQHRCKLCPGEGAHVRYGKQRVSAGMGVERFNRCGDVVVGHAHRVDRDAVELLSEVTNRCIAPRAHFVHDPARCFLHLRICVSGCRRGGLHPVEPALDVGRQVSWQGHREHPVRR